MDSLKNYDIDYWNKKVKAVVEISKEYGYPEQDREFWIRQPAGVISLILDIKELSTTKLVEIE